MWSCEIWRGGYQIWYLTTKEYSNVWVQVRCFKPLMSFCFSLIYLINHICWETQTVFPRKLSFHCRHWRPPLSFFLSGYIIFFSNLYHRLSFGVFQDLFWRLKLKKPGLVVVSCPDVMFNIYDREVPDANYADLANKWHVKKWVDSSGRIRWYGCRKGPWYTRSGLCNLGAGLAVPPCDLENLADAIKFVMKECEEAGLFCELQEGTLLGTMMSSV